MRAILFFLALFFFTNARADLISANTSATLDFFGVCRIVSNTSGTGYFAPTGTSNDWNNFLTHLPAGVTATTCNTFAWSITGWSACAGGTGYWSYSGFGACTGGSGSWGPFGACSVACGGGTQSATCNWNPNSGVQYQTASCILNTNSGTQTRTVTCLKNGSVVVADSFCTAPKPATSQSCTPTDTSLCGAQAALSQACTPGGAPTCAGPGTQTCNTQSCEPCSGYNACNPDNYCIYNWGLPPGSYASGMYCYVTAKYCLNGITVFDVDAYDGCTTYDTQVGVDCSLYP